MALAGAAIPGTGWHWLALAGWLAGWLAIAGAVTPALSPLHCHP